MSEMSSGADADTTAGEQLGRGEGRWTELWEHYAESPASYPGVVGLLRRSKHHPTPIRFHRCCSWLQRVEPL